MEHGKTSQPGKEAGAILTHTVGLMRLFKSQIPAEDNSNKNWGLWKTSAEDNLTVSQNIYSSYPNWVMSIMFKCIFIELRIS